MDNHETVKIGDLKNSEAIEVVKSKFNKKIYQSAAVLEGADELTLREGDATPPMWEPADGGHRGWTKISTQFVQPSTKGVEGAKWENLYYKLAVMNKEVYVRNLSSRSKAKTLWKIRDAKKEVTRIVTNPTRQKLSVGRMSTKSCGVYSSRARPLPCQRRLRKVETWEDAESSAGKGTEADFMCVSSCAVSRRLASGGACKFSCVLSSVHRLAVRADLRCWFVPICELWVYR